MKDKISKIKNAIKKYGIIITIKKIIKRIMSRIGPKINIIGIIKTKNKEPKYKKELEKAIKSVDRVIVWRSPFGWNVPLYQRPQHISYNLSKKKSLVIYEVTTETDDVKDIKKQHENLYLVNFNNPVINNIIRDCLKNISKPKYIQIYSTNWSMSVEELKEYISEGYKVIYEYIDDLSPQLAGTKELPVNIKTKYDYAMSDKNVFVVGTAEAIMEDIINNRGNKRVALACNGVDYKFFKNLDKNYKLEEEFENIVKQGKPIIGYYGALASWFDYNLVKKLAEERPNYNIVLFGIKYDESFDKSNLNKYDNIYFLGSRDYNVLKNYAKEFTVCTIPFLINSITEATSPVKLFEYMALEKPIVTTDMKECRKYSSVMISKTNEEFIKLIDKAISLNPTKDKKYFDILQKEALENTWDEKAKIIIELLKKYE